MAKDLVGCQCVCKAQCTTYFVSGHHRSANTSSFTTASRKQALIHHRFRKRPCTDVFSRIKFILLISY